MALFQTSVLKKYLKVQDFEPAEKAYKWFTKYFHNTITPENIRCSKEEKLQRSFLWELFANVPGYTLTPSPTFNLTCEFKNKKRANKADDAILRNDKAIAVIELKGAKAKDLEKMRRKAFDNKAPFGVDLCFFRNLAGKCAVVEGSEITK